MRYSKWSPMRRFRPLLLVSLWAFAGCSNEDAAPARAAAPGLGLDIFGVLCDRVGAQALHEDLTGGSYQDICHGSASKVDTTKLPAAPDANVRRLAIGKIEALAAHKQELIAALDTVFPDDIVVGKNLDAADPVASCDPISSKTRRDQLRGLLTRLLPSNGDDTVPDSSRAAAVSIEPLTSDQGASARTAMQHLAARRGYMPPETASGLLGSVLTAPRLRDLLAETMSAFGPDADPYNAPGTKGKGYDQLHAFIGAVQTNLAKPIDQEKAMMFSTDSIGRTVPSRPYTGVELARNIALTENPVFSNGTPLLVTKRDWRGMAVVAKDANGKLPAPFLDLNGDGLADLDPNTGHYALTSTATSPPVEPFSGDTKSNVYEYTDARQTAISAMVRHIAPLADPDGGKESVMNGLEGFEPLLRERESFLDLIQAAGQMSADPSTDDALALLGQLFKEQPQLMARVVGNLLDAKAILDAHPEARLPDGSTLFDDLTDVLVKIAAEPGLLEDALTSMADDRGQYIKEAIPAMMTFKDQISYDPNSINGLPKNLTNGGGPPDSPVDRSQPNLGLNRSIFQRFLQLLHDTNGVTFCNKDQAILHGVIQLDTGYTNIDLPLDGPAPECGLLKIENLSQFYMRAMVGKAPLQFRPAFFNPPPPQRVVMSADILQRSTGIDGFWDPTTDGRDSRTVYPEPQFLNRQVFFQIDPNLVCDDTNKYTTPCVLKDLQGMHMPSSACAERSIPDPLAGDNTAVDNPPVGAVVDGLRTCQDGQWLDQRDANTLFALEYNHGYDAFAPLVEAFVNHDKDDLLVDVMDTLNTHWSVNGGVAAAEPALAEILKTDIVPSLGALAKVTNGMQIKRCVVDGSDPCQSVETVPAVRVLADGLRAMVDPVRAQQAGVKDRRGGTTTKSGKPISILGMLRDALNEEDTVLGADKTKLNKWQTSRSHFVDEFFTVNGRGTDAQFADPGVAQLAPVIIDLLRQQRLAKCAGDVTCQTLRVGLATDLESDLTDPVFTSGLDLVDVVLADPQLRGEIGRMAAYMFRQSTALGGANASASATPFSQSSSSLAPGALDQTISALVDALGGLGDLSDVRGLYPVLAHSLDSVDPELALLSRLNARAYDANGNEICAKELDPEEAIRNTLARVSMTVTVPGQPTKTALQIFLDTIADVNRVDATINGPLAPADYTNVFTNVHELLTDPQSGLEQLYASVKNATAK